MEYLDCRIPTRSLPICGFYLGQWYGGFLGISSWPKQYFAVMILQVSDRWKLINLSIEWKLLSEPSPRMSHGIFELNDYLKKFDTVSSSACEKDVSKWNMLSYISQSCKFSHFHTCFSTISLIIFSTKILFIKLFCGRQWNFLRIFSLSDLATKLLFCGASTSPKQPSSSTVRNRFPFFDSFRPGSVLAQPGSDKLITCSRLVQHFQTAWKLRWMKFVWRNI